MRKLGALAPAGGNGFMVFEMYNRIGVVWRRSINWARPQLANGGSNAAAEEGEASGRP